MCTMLSLSRYGYQILSGDRLQFASRRASSHAPLHAYGHDAHLYWRTT
jgi:hypothetical protein